MQYRDYVPNLFVIGVPKAGSTSMQRWLGAHPEIGTSSEVETRYLMDAGDPLCRADGYAACGLDGYSGYYPDRLGPGKIRYLLDVTPQYYYQETAKDVISRLDAKKVIMILRKPSDRILSLYKYTQNNTALLSPEMSFADFVHEIYLGPGSALVRARPMLRHAITHCQYARFVGEWATLVGGDNLQVIIFEEFVKDPGKVLKKIATDLAIDPGLYDSYGFPATNESYSVRLHWLHKMLRRSRKYAPAWLRYQTKQAYLRLNTKRYSKYLSDQDRDTIAALDREFLGWEQKLTQALGRSEPIWSRN